MVEMKVYGLAVDEDVQTPVLILKDKAEKTTLPIWIGAMEAMAISLAINEVQLPRPMTHDLLLTTISTLDAKVISVNVISLREGTYYAEIHIERAGKLIQIDCRPSDGIALALRADVPIWVDEDVISLAESERRAPEGKPELHNEEAKQWNDLLEQFNIEGIKYKM